MSKDELEEIRRKKLEQLQQQAAQQRQQEEAKERNEDQKDAFLRTVLTQEARQRLTNLKMVKPELADNIVNQLAKIVQSGQSKRLGLQIPLSDAQFKDLLTQIINRQQRQDFKITKI